MPHSASPDGDLHVAQMIGGLGWGGTQELIAIFSEHCAQYGITLSVLVLRPPEATPYERRIMQHGARVSYIPARMVLSPRRLLRLVRLLRRTGVDLIHAHLPTANTLAPIAGWLAGIPVIGGLHLPVAESTWRGSLRARLEAFLLRAGARAAVACGPKVAEENRKRLGRLPAISIPNPARRAPELGPGRSGGRNHENCRFITVGRLAPEKGYDVLLRAVALARAQSPCLELALVGDGPLRAKLEGLRSRLGLHDVVRFLGARDDVPELLAQSDVYVSSSRSEGLSLALLEAMAHGLPVIATTVGDTPFAVGDAGRLVPQEDPSSLAAAMLDAAKDIDLRLTIGRSGQARVRRDFKPEVWAERLAELYRHVAIGPGQGLAG